MSQALIWAPSAGNLLSRKFYFIYREDIRKGLVGAALGQLFIADAPLLIVICADKRIADHYGKRGTDLYMLQDSAASVQNLLLAAHEMGLATCWIGAFKEEPVVAALNLPVNLRPIAMVPVGYPAEQPSPPQRVSKTDAVIKLR